MTTIQEQCERIIQLAEKASPAPWKTWGMEVMSDPKNTSDLDDCIPVGVTHYRNEDGRSRTNDADFIAETRSFAPSLLRSCGSGSAQTGS